MRLTTLNLDQECLDILGRMENKSRYVRTCIKRFDETLDELNRIEDLYTRYLSAMRNLCAALAEPSFDLATYMDETPLAITKMCDSGYLKDAIVAAALRHVRP